MCGRYVLASSLPQLAAFFDAAYDASTETAYRPSWNVPPSRLVLALTTGEGGRVISRYRWGLVPSWAKEESFGARTFNARAESVATKPTFRAAFKSRRAIVPADAFYEWSKIPGEGRQPYAFARADGSPLAFAGLWETWRDPARSEEEDAPVRSCTIVTTEAGEDLGGIHDRQPVVLEREAVDRWLDPELRDRDELEAMLRPSPTGTLLRHRVGRAIGKVGIDGPALLEAI